MKDEGVVENVTKTTIIEQEKIISKSDIRNENRQNVVIVSMLTFGFVYACHLVKESVIFLYDVWEEGQMYLNESDVQFFVVCWILFFSLLVIGLWILVYIWLKFHGSKTIVVPDKNE